MWGSREISCFWDQGYYIIFVVQDTDSDGEEIEACLR
jgi:hypothetical protein